MTTRTCEYKRTRKLKDGTVKEFMCKQTYNVKKGRVICGKQLLKNRLTSCQDKEKIERIKVLFDELGL